MVDRFGSVLTGHSINFLLSAHRYFAGLFLRGQPLQTQKGDPNGCALA